MPTFYGVLTLVMTHTPFSIQPHRPRRRKAGNTFHPPKTYNQEIIWTLKRS
ncbi:MAG: hypothetical protein QOJ76_637 [Acidobacteriota bacterium]|nr:hypothetical protein [Acidobacteriota bacterium]